MRLACTLRPAYTTQAGPDVTTSGQAECSNNSSCSAVDQLRSTLNPSTFISDPSAHRQQETGASIAGPESRECGPR